MPSSRGSFFRDQTCISCSSWIAGRFFTAEPTGKPTGYITLKSENHSVVSDSLQPHGLCSPWNSPGQNTGVGSLSLLQILLQANSLISLFTHSLSLLIYKMGMMRVSTHQIAVIIVLVQKRYIKQHSVSFLLYNFLYETIIGASQVLLFLLTDKELKMKRGIISIGHATQRKTALKSSDTEPSVFSTPSLRL